MASALARVARTVEKVGTRVKRFMHRFRSQQDADKFREECRNSKYSFECILPDLVRITGGGFPIHVLLWVHQKSANRGAKDGGPCRYIDDGKGWSPEDFIKSMGGESACTKSGMYSAIVWLCQHKLLSSKAIDDGRVDTKSSKWSPFKFIPGKESDSEDLYSWRICYEKFNKDTPTARPQKKDVGSAEEIGGTEEVEEPEGTDPASKPLYKPRLLNGAGQHRSVDAGRLIACGKMGVDKNRVPLAVQVNGAAATVHFAYSEKIGIATIVDVILPKAPAPVRSIDKGPPESASDGQPPARRRRAPAPGSAAPPEEDPYLAEIAHRFDGVIEGVIRTWPKTQRSWCIALFAECDRRVVAAGLPGGTLTPELLGAGIKECKKKEGGDRQRSAGWFAKKLPDESVLADWCQTWAEGRAPTLEPQPALISDEVDPVEAAARAWTAEQRRKRQ
jgi:hypothetical protein